MDPGPPVDAARQWRRLMEMAAIGATPRGGVNRAALSPEDARARQLMARWAGELGFAVGIDEVANLYIRRAGRDGNAAPVIAGSHLDSQPTGGKFDGAYGVIGGLEALEAIERAGIATERPIEVVAWTNEEGGRFQPGYMGSRVYVDPGELAGFLPLFDRDGVTVESALADTLDACAGIARRAAGGPAAAYIEAHIEQGPILEETGDTIGVVTGIQGQRHFSVEVIGAEAHAGTTPRAIRKDALQGAIAMISALNPVLADDADTVRFTVGRFEVFPCSPNVVPGRVFFTIDFRHPEQSVIAALTDRIEPVLRAHARGCQVTLRETSRSLPTEFDPDVIAVIRDQATALALPHRDIPSGAGHDAIHMAKICPAGMIFVPCAGGVSHNEAESATAADLAAGASVLAASLVALANRV